MIEIANITHRADHIRLDLNDGERLYVPLNRLPEHSLKKGMELTDLQYRQIREESERYECREKAYSYLAMKSCSERQITLYLKRKKFSELVILETVRGLAETGYINDLDFSMNYIRVRKGRKAIGKNMLIKELGGKGVARKTIEKAMRETGADRDDLEEAYETARKKYEKVREKPNAMSRVGMFLRQRGYQADTIRGVLNRLDADAGEFWEE